MMAARLSRLLFCACVVSAAGLPVSAQQAEPAPAFGSAEALRLRRPAESAASHAAPQEQEDEREPAPEPAPRPASSAWPLRLVEVAFSGEAVWLGLRGPLGSNWRDHFGLGLVVSDEDDVLVEGRVMRYGGPHFPWRLGVGLEVFAAFLDESDDEAYGLGLVGSAAYEIGTPYPSRVELTLAFAPDSLVFKDGEGLIDLRLSYEVDISEQAAAFVGFRRLEVEREDGPDADLDDAVHVGLRIAL